MNLTRRKFGKLIAGLMGSAALPPVALALVKSPSITGDTFLNLATNQTYVRVSNQWVPLGNVVA